MKKVCPLHPSTASQTLCPNNDQGLREENFFGCCKEMKACCKSGCWQRSILPAGPVPASNTPLGQPQSQTPGAEPPLTGPLGPIPDGPQSPRPVADGPALKPTTPSPSGPQAPGTEPPVADGPALNPNNPAPKIAPSSPTLPPPESSPGPSPYVPPSNTPSPATLEVPAPAPAEPFVVRIQFLELSSSVLCNDEILEFQSLLYRLV